MLFIKELKRRNVVKVASVYLVSAWLILQVVSVITPALNLPPIFTTITVIVLVLGFPLVCIFAWAFELTPEGIQRSNDAPLDDEFAVQKGNNINRMLAVGLVLALGLIVYQYFTSSGNAVKANELSIAVLPFRDMSPDNSQEYFGDGMAEEILNSLARLNKMMVISRTSSFAFKDKGADIREIGQTLEVDYILEGAVRKVEDTIRITVNLIDVKTGAQVWSEGYDRKLDSIFALQKELTLAITNAMKLNLLQEEISLHTGMTQNANAYDLFIQARELQYSRKSSAIATSISLLKQSLTIDPDFHLAVAQLYLGYYLAEVYGGATQASIDEQLDLLFWRLLDAPDFGLKYAVLSTHAITNAPNDADYDSQFALAQKAYDLSPHEAYINHHYAFQFARKFSLNAAIDLREKIMQSDPYNIINFSALANLYLQTNRPEGLYKVQSDIMQIAPFSFEAFYINEIVHYKYEKNVPKAIDAIQQFSDKNNNPEYHVMLANLLALNGDAIAVSTIIMQQAEEQGSFDFGNYLNAYFLIYILHSNNALSEAQTRAFKRIEVPQQFVKPIQAVRSLLKGNAAPYLDVTQKTHFSNQELIESKGPYGRDAEYIAAIRKKSGDDSLAKAVMENPHNQRRVTQCLKYQGAIWPDCPLWLYLDGKLSEEQQFKHFKNALVTLTANYYGDEIFMMTSPAYFGVSDYPTFSKVAQNFMSATFPNFSSEFSQ